MNKVAISTMTGFGLGMILHSLFTKNKNNIDVEKAKISNKNYRAMTTNFPLLISFYGRFSEKNVNRYLQIIERVHELPASDNFIESTLHKMLFKKEKYKFTKRDIKKYFESVEFILNIREFTSGSV